MNHFGQNFHFFFHWPLFSQIFWMELKRRPLSIRQGRKFSLIRALKKYDNLESVTYDPLLDTMKHPNVVEFSQMEETYCIQRVI